jgi:hypothetical protein
MRYLKAVGLAALAALMASAMFASAASAEEPGLLTAGATPETHKAADITATQYGGPAETEEDWNFFTGKPGSGELVTCDNATMAGTTTSGTVKELTVEADYRECQADGQAATVTMNGCDYILTQPTTVGEEYTGKADLTCPENNKIQIHVYLFGNSTSGTHSFNVCTIEVYPHDEGPHREQELGGHVMYKDVPESDPDDVTATVTLDEITVDDNCSGEHHETEGVYKQTLTVEAFEHDKLHNAENQLDLWLSKEGA